MQKKTIVGVLIDVKNQSIERKELVVKPKDTLKTLYKVLDCDLITITSRKINGKYYDIYCDDEGLLKPNPIPAIIMMDNKELDLIVGNCFICSANEEGETISISELEVTSILSTVKTVAGLYGEPLKMIPATYY